MASNPYANKVTVNGSTILDLTSDTVSPEVLMQGYTAHDASGAPITGTASGGARIGTDTVSASGSYPTSISFDVEGEPLAFVVRSTTQISSSGSTSYYYVIAVVYDGNDVTGTLFRIGSTRRTQNVTSGYSYTYSNGTLTVRSSASSRSSTPGAFNGTYELTYVY